MTFVSMSRAEVKRQDICARCHRKVSRLSYIYVQSLCRRLACSVFAESTAAILHDVTTLYLVNTWHCLLRIGELVC